MHRSYEKGRKYMYFLSTSIAVKATFCAFKQLLFEKYIESYFTITTETLKNVTNVVACADAPRTEIVH